MSLLSSNLQAFQAIVKSKTVHGAAKSIGLTQTGVTQRIRVLERDLGATLFTRSRKGMLLTQEGEALHRYCQAATELEGSTLSQIMGAAQTSEIQMSLTGPTSILSSRVIPQCLNLAKDYSGLLFNFIVNDLEKRVENLRSGNVQMAIVPPELVAKEMDSKLLKPEKFILVATSKWKGRKTKEIISKERIIDFDSTDDTTFSYLKSFNLIDLVAKSRHFVNENSALIQMFVSGMGFGTLNSEIAAPFIRQGSLIVLNSGKSFEQKHALAWYPRAQMPDYFRKLVRVIK